MDEDRSGAISYPELIMMVRDQLHMSPSALPEARLQASRPRKPPRLPNAPHSASPAQRALSHARPAPLHIVALPFAPSLNLNVAADAAASPSVCRLASSGGEESLKERYC